MLLLGGGVVPGGVSAMIRNLGKATHIVAEEFCSADTVYD